MSRRRPLLIAYGSGVVKREPVLEELAGMDMSMVYRWEPQEAAGT